jgi:hypothetical protein
MKFISLKSLNIGRFQPDTILQSHLMFNNLPSLNTHVLPKALDISAIVSLQEPTLLQFVSVTFHPPHRPHFTMTTASEQILTVLL